MVSNMRIKHRLVIYARGDDLGILNYLHRQGVKKTSQSDISFSIELFEDQDNFDAVMRGIESYNVVRNSPESVYTHEEISTAKWLTIRSSWRSLYPHPRDDFGFSFTTYDGTNYCVKAKESDGGFYWCGSGLVQKESFVLEKEPNWGPRNFLMINCVEDELFISSKAETVLRSSDLIGYDIQDVMNKKGNVMNGVKQLFVKNYLEEGLCENAIEEKLTCPKCGFIKYIPKAGANCFRKEIFSGVEDDVIKTKEKFGGIYCFSLIIVTHRFYEVNTKAKLDRGLVFEPVELI